MTVRVNAKFFTVKLNVYGVLAYKVNPEATVRTSLPILSMGSGCHNFEVHTPVDPNTDDTPVPYEMDICAVSFVSVSTNPVNVTADAAICVKSTFVANVTVMSLLAFMKNEFWPAERRTKAGEYVLTLLSVKELLDNMDALKLIHAP